MMKSYTGVWIIVLIGGFFETVWALCMKMSYGFTVPNWTLITIGFMFISVGLLNYGIKKGVPVGGGYAVWAGVGAIGSIALGIIIYGEAIAIERFFFAALIIIGIVGVEMMNRPNAESTKQDRTE
jgi:quaternary ammonium compound-resistance protein SugE